MDRWRPKEGQRYYFPSVYYGTPAVASDIWENKRLDGDRYQAGMVCRTKKKALELSQKLLDVLNKKSWQTEKPPTRRSKYMTNRDNINGMSNDRLADILSRVDNAYNTRCKFCILWGEDCFLGGFSCADGIKAWLDSPVKQPTDNKAEKLSVVLDKVL